MKKQIINIFAFVTLFACCTPVGEKNGQKEDGKKLKLDTITTEISKRINTIASILPSDISDLVPIHLLNSKDVDVYEKYGIEFSGNCYSCDLASLSVKKNKMIWTNVCDDDDTFVIDNFIFYNEANKTILKTSERTYILTRIEEAPIYELIIEGEKLELENKRLSRFYTTKQALKLFKEHDCGEFDG